MGSLHLWMACSFLETWFISPSCSGDITQGLNDLSCLYNQKWMVVKLRIEISGLKVHWSKSNPQCKYLRLVAKYWNASLSVSPVTPTRILQQNLSYCSWSISKSESSPVNFIPHLSTGITSDFYPTRRSERCIPARCSLEISPGEREICPGVVGR